MKIEKNNIIFLIRAYNEEKQIKAVIKNINEAWYKNILVVDDWSKDKTWEIVQNIENIIYIEHKFNRGWWAALETGFEYLRNNKKLWFDYVVTFDADWQHDIDDIWKFIKAFKKDNELDIVLGSRFVTKTETNVPFTRKMILYWGRVFTYLLSWIYLTDSHNGYRMIKTSVLDKIELTMDGMEYASELIEQIRIKDLKYREVPVNIKYTEYSIKKWQKSLNAISIARKMIRNKFFK